MQARYNSCTANMESMAAQRKTALDSSLPLRSLQPQSSQLNFGRVPSPFGYKGAGGAIRRTPIPEPPYSPISSSSRASFSQASCADSWEVISTAPSSPQSPLSKYEPDETLIELESIPFHRGTLKHRRESHDGITNDIKDIKLSPIELPSLNHLLGPADRKNHHPSSYPRARSSNRPYPSQAPKEKYTLSDRKAYSSSEDPIVQCLNLWRGESGNARGLLLNIDLNFHDPAPAQHREKQRYAPQPRGYRQQPCQQPSPGVENVEPEDDHTNAKIPHNNVKYSLEETDFIRFNRYEMKLSWEEGKRLFRERFPMANAKMDRATQGIQGVHYRNNTHVPSLLDKGRKLQFMPNGHVKAVQAKVRNQGEFKPYFSLVYLYPERALLYDWVPLKFKQEAARLVNERNAQKEAKKRELMRTGEWREKDDTGTCACCPKPDRERDDVKRLTSKPSERRRPSRQTQMRGQRRLFGSIDLVGPGMGVPFYPREHLYAEAKRRKFEAQNI